MSEYKVLITETWKRAVTVDAESREEAEETVRCQYKNGEYALVSADSDGVSFSAQYPEQQVELSYGKLRELFRKAERGGIHVSGYILVCDPEREYYALGQALGGEVVRIAAGSPDHINAMDMVEGYGDGGNPVVDKSEFILSLFEQLDRGGIGPLQKSIIDRCVDAVYAAYKRGGPVPTLCVLREKLLEQPEEEARDLALALELFTTGSLDAFAHETNVDTQNRIVIYDIMDLGRQLKTMGLLIITDAMLNRVTENWRKGKRTHLFIDEFHVVFQNPYSADFFDSAWRRFRKRGAYPTAITQNVEYLLDSVQASTMLSNSEMLILLNQAPSDREKLAALLNISPEQTSYITNAPAGCGLLRYGGALVPFKNQFPKDTELYRLMTTKPDESIIVGGKTK